MEGHLTPTHADTRKVSNGESSSMLTTMGLAHSYLNQQDWLYCAARQGAGLGLLSVVAGDGQAKLSCPSDLTDYSPRCQAIIDGRGKGGKAVLMFLKLYDMIVLQSPQTWTAMVFQSLIITLTLLI